MDVGQHKINVLLMKHLKSVDAILLHQMFQDDLDSLKYEMWEICCP